MRKRTSSRHIASHMAWMASHGICCIPTILPIPLIVLLLLLLLDLTLRYVPIAIVFSGVHRLGKSSSRIILALPTRPCHRSEFAYVMPVQSPRIIIALRAPMLVDDSNGVQYLATVVDFPSPMFSLPLDTIPGSTSRHPLWPRHNAGHEIRVRHKS